MKPQPNGNDAAPSDQPEKQTEPTDQPETGENPGVSEPEAADDFSAVVPLRPRKPQDLPQAFDPFSDLDRIRNRKTAAEPVVSGTPDRPIKIPCKRPSSEVYLRVHPDPEFVFDIDGAEYARDLYYVDRDMVQELRSRFIKVNEYRLYCCIQRDLDGNLSHRVMPVRLPDASGRDTDWWETLHAAAELCRGGWRRIVTDLSAGVYSTVPPPKSYPDPVWPDWAPADWLRMAFGKRVILDGSHFLPRNLGGAKGDE